jgi:hypothetical protein
MFRLAKNKEVTYLTNKMRMNLINTPYYNHYNVIIKWPSLADCPVAGNKESALIFSTMPGFSIAPGYWRPPLLPPGAKRT